MGLFDYFNRRLFKRLRRNAPVLIVDGDIIKLVLRDGAQHALPFANLTGATVLHRDVYVADAILIRLIFRNGERVEIFQDDPQWEAMVSALDRSGQTNTPSALWQIQSIADGPDAALRELIDRESVR